MKYQAVNRDQLVEILGKTCSPMPSRNGYVIGPDLSGRVCHIASCFTLGEAEKRADKLNREINEVKA